MTSITGIATSFIDFTRASNATVTDSDGKVKWAPHNLLLASESFDAASWAKSSVMPTANSIAAPNGTTTADTLAASGANGTTLQTFTAEAISYTFGVWLKRKTGTGNIQIAADSGTYTTVTITSDWALYTVTQTPTAGSKTAGIRIVTSADEVYAWGASLYRSDLAMQPNTSAYPMYNPTTPKNLLGYTESLITGWTGTNGGLQSNGVELVPNGTFNTDISGWSVSTSYPDGTIGWNSGAIRLTNTSVSSGYVGAYVNLSGTKANTFYLVTATCTSKTSQFWQWAASSSLVAQNSDWGGSANQTVANTISKIVYTTNANFGIWVSSYGTTGQYADLDNISVQEVVAYEAPNGLQTARAVNATSANGTLLGSVSLLASPYTFSIWLKRKTGSGTVEITVDGTTYVAAAVTGTWTRFSTTLTPLAGNRSPGIRLVTSGDAVYAWGAQLSDSASLDAYSPVYGAAVTSAAYYGPRRDFDPVTLACKGLLVEELRSNLVLSSADFGSWSDIGATVAANTVVSPDGTMTADELARVSTTTDSRAKTVTFTGDGTKSVSIYVKYNTAPTFAVFLYDSTAVVNRMLIDFAFTAGVPASSTVNSGSVEAIENAGGGWYRIKLLCPSVVAANTNVLYVYPARTGSANGQKTTFWGAQAENGSFATSYIPVGATSAGATRNADIASVSAQAFPYSATEGTMVINGAVLATVAANRGAFNLASPDGSIRFGNNVSGAGATSADFYTLPGGTFLVASGAVTAGTPFKAAAVYKASDFALSANGAAAVTSSSGTLPTAATDAHIGRIGSSSYFNGWIRQITYLPRRISNAELVTRST